MEMPWNRYGANAVPNLRSHDLAMTHPQMNLYTFSFFPHHSGMKYCHILHVGTTRNGLKDISLLNKRARRSRNPF
jgi:hypothetical protein